MTTHTNEPEGSAVEGAVGRSQLHGVIALDGPSGTGKSTVARRLAARLGARYLDTGAMYRGMTLAVLQAQVDPTDADKVIAVVLSENLVVATDPANPVTLLSGVDVSTEIRSQAVTTAVSPVSAVPEVRRLLVELQRELIASALRDVGGIVVEGRDIGTVVAPKAGLKVYLTASARIRAERRAHQNAAGGTQSDVAAILADIERRDAYDSTRQTSPAQKADDAIELDTTFLDLASTERKLLVLAEQHGIIHSILPEVTS